MQFTRSIIVKCVHFSLQGCMYDLPAILFSSRTLTCAGYWVDDSNFDSNFEYYQFIKIIFFYFKLYRSIFFGFSVATIITCIYDLKFLIL